MVWVNAIAFILSVIPIVFNVFYYYLWSSEFYLSNTIYVSTAEKHDKRETAMVMRAIVEGGLFLSQLVWIYVLQTFGADKAKNAKPEPVVEVER